VPLQCLRFKRDTIKRELYGRTKLVQSVLPTSGELA